MKTEEVEETTSTTDIGLISKVILFNDNYHTFRQVVRQLHKVTGCSEQNAFSLTCTIHETGKAVVYKGKMIDCISVSSIFKEINIKTQIIT